MTCIITDCPKRASYGEIEKKPTHCFDHGNKLGLRNVVSTKCIIEGCIKGVAYAEKRGDKPIYCPLHGKEKEMIDVVTKRCDFPNCSVKPTFGSVGTTIATRCFEHKGNLVDVKNSYCIYKGCTVSAKYGKKGTKKPIYCSTHGKDKKNFIDVTITTCLDKDCGIRPTYGKDNDSKPVYCAKHGKEHNYIYVSSGLCNADDCAIRASYGIKGTKRKLFCKKHADESEDDYVNVTCGRCKIAECDIYPTYGKEGTKTALYCSLHGKNNNCVDVVNSKCLFENCTTVSNFAEVGSKKPTHCKQHGYPLGYVDIHRVECKTDHCINTGNINKYKGYCFRCFIYTFPDQVITRNYKVKELRVVDAITAEFPDLKEHFLFDTVAGACSKRRADISIDCGSHVVIIEIDEEQHNLLQHSDYKNDKRNIELIQDYGNRPVVFIRFNPDKYIDRNSTKIQSCFSKTKVNNFIKIDDKTGWDFRLSTLFKKFHHHINNVPEENIIVEKLFFDGY